jgi:predicted transcriptional regulator of viral defense system
MLRRSVLADIQRIRRPIFTTFELARISERSASATTQALRHLEKQGVVEKIYRGIWGLAGSERLSAASVIPFLFPRTRAYVSFTSALHLYDIIEQIPQVMTLASPSHTKTIRTRLGTYSVHRIAPSFFAGFRWYKDEGRFLVAEPEKALVDSLYLSARKKRQYGHFPELHFPRTFSFRRAREWAGRIPDVRIRKNVEKKLAAIIEGGRGKREPLIAVGK